MRRLVLVGSMAAACALGVAGCLSGDDAAGPGADAGAFVPEGGVPVFDASGSVDGAPGVKLDAGADAPVSDAGTDAPPPTDSGITGTVTLAAGAALSRSSQHTLKGVVGPASAPVLHSSKYQLVGGMAVAAQPK